MAAVFLYVWIKRISEIYSIQFAELSVECKSMITVSKGITHIALVQKWVNDLLTRSGYHTYDTYIRVWNQCNVS